MRGPASGGGIQPTGMAPASVYREASTFVALGAVIILFAHAVEVSAAGAPNWPALAIRIVWFAALLGVAWMFRSESPTVRLAGTIVGIFGSAVLDVAILWVTGRSASPLLFFTPVLATVLPVVAFDAIGIGLAGSALLIAGTGLVLATDGAPAPAYIALVNAGGGAIACGWLLARAFSRSRRAEVRRREELAEALSSIRTLRGLLPVCAWCRRVRSDAGYWEQLEVYISAHSDTTFSHGLCQDCAQLHFPDLVDPPLEATTGDDAAEPSAAPR